MFLPHHVCKTCSSTSTHLRPTGPLYEVSEDCRFVPLVAQTAMATVALTIIIQLTLHIK